MRGWKRLLISAMALCLLCPATLWAAEANPDSIEEESPSFQNVTQADRAKDLAISSFTEEDMEKAREIAALEADEQIKQFSSDYADGVVDEVSTDHANKIVDEKARTHADELIETKAHEHALSFGDEGSDAYNRAYAAAWDRATDTSFHNAWDTAYESELSRTTDPNAPDYDNATWQEAYDYAYKRATNPDYHNARQTAYEYAYGRATNPDFPNVYQTEYKKALEGAVADITGEQLQRIHQMRYVEKLGLGVITKKLGLHQSNSGRGNAWKHRVGPLIDDEIIPSGPPQVEDISLEDEIAEVTRRNTRTGWVDDQEFQTKGNKHKGSKKVYGLAQTSGLASEDVRGKRNDNNGNGKNKSSSGISGNYDVSDVTQNAALNKSKSNNGKNNNSSNGNQGGNNSSNGNQGGNNSSNGNQGGNNSSNGNQGGNNSSNGNKGGNGNNSGNNGGNGKGK